MDQRSGGVSPVYLLLFCKQVVRNVELLAADARFAQWHKRLSYDIQFGKVVLNELALQSGTVGRLQHVECVQETDHVLLHRVLQDRRVERASTNVLKSLEDSSHAGGLDTNDETGCYPIDGCGLKK
eukprot:m.77310 g.77310  ORF g.77310 m.77310 type:complete len:126 (-) comp25000_c2_seq1:1726-2103(-)